MRGEKATHIVIAFLAFHRSQYTCDGNHKLMQQIYTFMGKHKLKISSFIKLEAVEMKCRLLL